MKCWPIAPSPGYLRAWIPAAASLIASLTLVAWTATAGAVEIYHSDASPLVPAPAQGAFFADVLGSFSEAADELGLLVDQIIIRDVNASGIYNSGVANLPADNFIVTVYDDDASSLVSVNSTAIISSLIRTATTGTINSRTMYKYDAVISDIALSTGATYRPGISNDSASNTWAWVQNANSGGNAKLYSASNGSFGRSTRELAFNLTNDIP